MARSDPKILHSQYHSLLKTSCKNSEQVCDMSLGCAQGVENDCNSRGTPMRKSRERAIFRTLLPRLTRLPTTRHHAKRQLPPSKLRVCSPTANRELRTICSLYTEKEETPNLSQNSASALGMATQIGLFRAVATHPRAQAARKVLEGIVLRTAHGVHPANQKPSRC